MEPKGAQEAPSDSPHFSVDILRAPSAQANPSGLYKAQVHSLSWEDAGALVVNLKSRCSENDCGLSLFSDNIRVSYGFGRSACRRVA